ncbi:hypothetical protein CUJ84_Chr001658 [Rhizobium leguminosarum]|uniref:Uncharacterized protein n=1 Tax=Rhizobium leguminosarum TaxID=384 RepID=A0A2K9Z1R4_RHILE|nr:hypothetical protein CUJ84_Chr001658 [Rhizobium leguminosarum]
MWRLSAAFGPAFLPSTSSLRPSGRVTASEPCCICRSPRSASFALKGRPFTMRDMFSAVSVTASRASRFQSCALLISPPPPAFSCRLGTKPPLMIRAAAPRPLHRTLMSFRCFRKRAGLADADFRRGRRTPDQDGLGTALPDEGAEHLERFAACQHQPPLPLTQRPVERFQRMMQPPGLRSAQRTGVCCLRLSYIERDDRPPEAMGGFESLLGMYGTRGSKVSSGGKSFSWPSRHEKGRREPAFF